LDYINGDITLKRLLADRPSPVIVTCRRQQDGGKFKGSEEDRKMLLRSAIAEGVEYIDLEEDLASEIPRFGKTKRIISLHDFRKTPSDLAAVHKRLAALDADIVKMATIANRPHDNLRMLRLIRDSKVPTVGMCMGDIGTPSRILAGKFGAPFTYATFHHERTLAPGQLSFGQMTDIYHYDQINKETDVFGVIADPVGHSLSPQLHNAAFAEQSINAVYIPFRVPKEDLEEFIEDSRELGVKGLSVTIPHKENVLRWLNKVDGSVRGIGDDRIGYNTDYRAAMGAIEKKVGGGENPLKGKRALVLGSGGVAKAIVYGLRRRGVDVVVAGRTISRARFLADTFGAKAVDWKARHSVGFEILANCTPIGMHPNVDESPFDKHHLKPAMIVFDTVYNPESTLLLKQAKSQSCRTITGATMFIRQAALQYKLFTGKEAPVKLMGEVFKRAILPAKM
jgi:3-dehydroquinate dehydratase/shikimate dehydrogenase